MSDRTLDAAVAVRAVPQLAHLLLHCEPHDAPAIGERLGLNLPGAMLRSGTARGWSALHLAPDEWLLIGALEAGKAMIDAFEVLGRELPVSLVDISDRGLAFDLVGRGVEELLAAGCPMDLAEPSFPVGGCTRTLFGKAMVMLRRTGPAAFRLEVARSFAPYVLALLARAADEQG
jgi:sarcosine oxidase subunit gamma